MIRAVVRSASANQVKLKTRRGRGLAHCAPERGT